MTGTSESSARTIRRSSGWDGDRIAPADQSRQLLAAERRGDPFRSLYQARPGTRGVGVAVQNPDRSEGKRGPGLRTDGLELGQRALHPEAAQHHEDEVGTVLGELAPPPPGRVAPGRSRGVASLRPRPAPAPSGPPETADPATRRRRHAEG